jgi:PhoPQ-activated pathogenicity-related protein
MINEMKKFVILTIVLLFCVLAMCSCDPPVVVQELVDKKVRVYTDTIYTYRLKSDGVIKNYKVDNTYYIPGDTIDFLFGMSPF